MKNKIFTDFFLFEGINFEKSLQNELNNLSDAEVKEKFEAIKKIYLSVPNKNKLNESQTVENIIIPILKILGHTYTSEITLENLRIDYLLFETEEDKEKFIKNNDFSLAISILEAKRFNRNLKIYSENEDDRHIPENQIKFYLWILNRKSKGKIKWGILTNGRIWRLYHYEEKNYLSFDFDKFFNSVLSSNDLFIQEVLSEFKIFLFFFRKEAFINKFRDERSQLSYSILDLALEKKKNWERKLRENIKEKIFRDVFRTFAQGIYQFLEKNNRKIDLEEIYQNTMILLYRFLFLFFANDKKLLPEIPSHYSFDKFRDELVDITDKKYSKNLARYWNWAKLFFKLIDQGDNSLQLLAYDGKLFNQKSFPLLEEIEIADYYFVKAFNALNAEYDYQSQKYVRINYKNLDVKHFGDIYEGLLEFKLKLAETDLTIKQKNGAEYYEAVKNHKDEIIVKKGELYLTNEKSQRKTTGTYYTPQVIVNFIINETLNPFYEKFKTEFEQKYSQIKSQKIKTEDKIFLLSKNDPALKLINLKILDPAMGSGHFLVSMLDILTQRIMDIFEYVRNFKLGDKNYKSPLEKEIEKLSSQYGLTKEIILKRIILKNTLFGVDLNPLAVELAKVSLWLHSFGKNAPLSFIDHHFKSGNSLIFTPIEKVKEQLQNLFGSNYIPFFNQIADTIKQINKSLDLKIEEIEQEEAQFEAINKKISHFKTFLDLIFINDFLEKDEKIDNFLSGGLGNPLKLLENNLEGIPAFDKALIKYAINITRDIKPFQWEIEFPEIWFSDGKKLNNPGFDIILGNPPYIKEPTNKEAFTYLKQLPCYKGKLDIWYLFGCLAIDLAKTGGYISYIATNNWITNAGAEKFRNYLLKNAEIKQFIDFNDYKIFKDAEIQTMIFVLEKKTPEASYEMLYASFSPKEYALKKEKAENNDENEDDPIKDFLENGRTTLTISPHLYLGKTLHFINPETAEIINKIESKANFKLRENEIINGIIPRHPFVKKDFLKILGKNFRANEGIFVLTDKELEKLNLTEFEKSIIKPLFTTKECQRYFCLQENHYWIIYTTSKFKYKNVIEKYPKIKAHLDKFKEVITSDNKPYGLHRARKEEFFKGEKIISLRKCPDRPQFSYVDFDSYVMGMFYVIKTQRINLKYLTGLLNSDLITFWFKLKGKMQGNNYQIDKEPLLRVPILKPDKEQEIEIAQKVDFIIKQNQKIYDFNKLKESFKRDKDFENLSAITKEIEKIQAEIEKADKELQDIFFKLYDVEAKKDLIKKVIEKEKN